MNDSPPTDTQSEEYVAIIGQDEVTHEAQNFAVKYDPLNRSGHKGFHVTGVGEFHIDDSKVIGERKLINKKIPNNAIQIAPLSPEAGQLLHQYDKNVFRLCHLPLPDDGSIIGLLGRNGIGKTTALRILAGKLVLNFGTPDRINWDRAVESFRGTTPQTPLERVRDGTVTTA